MGWGCSVGLLSTGGTFLTVSGICHSTLISCVTNDPLLSHLRSAMSLSAAWCSYLLMMRGGFDIRCYDTTTYLLPMWDEGGER